MNKEQAMSYGVREDAYREFQNHVNRDVKKRVQELAENRARAEAAFALKQIRDAISAMLVLVDDENTLQRVLTSVNRTYSDYLYRQRKAAEETQEATNAPETSTGGVAECP